MVNINFEKLSKDLNKELDDINRYERMEYYRRKYNDIENEQNLEQRKLLKWMEKTRIEMNKSKYSRKEKGWIHFQMNMFYQERSAYRKFKELIEESFKKWEEEEYYRKIKILYEKIEKTVKRIKRYKEMIDEYIDDKNTLKDIEEITKKIEKEFDLYNK